MRLDQTWCACDCINVKCPLNMGISVVYAAEGNGIDPETLKHADLSEDCEDYLKEESNDE